jgi:hypothetical protein
MFRSVAAASLLAFFSLLAVARGETLTLIPANPTGVPVSLDGYNSFALWGVSDASTDADLRVGTHISSQLVVTGDAALMPVGQETPDSPYWQYSLNGSVFAGGMGRFEGSPDNSQGFGFYLFPEPSSTTYYEFWVRSALSMSNATVYNLAGDTLASTGLPLGYYGKIGYSTTLSGPLILMLTPSQGPSPGLTVGAVTAQVQAVPEPECLLTVGLIAPIVGLATRRRFFSEQANPSP